MKEKDLRNGLRDYQDVRVEMYLRYLNELKKERWFGSIKTHEFIAFFKKVALDGVFIDGENVIFV